MSSTVSTRSDALRQMLLAFMRSARAHFSPTSIVLLGIIAGIVAAVLIRAFLVSIANALIVAMQWSTDILGPLLPESWREKLVVLNTVDEASPEVDLGLFAFGATFLFTKIQEIVATVSDLISKWKSAEQALLLKAFFSLMLCFAAVGLSVYGLKHLASPAASPTFVFDALSVPANMVYPDTGHFTFYIGFYDEGGVSTFDEENHGSVTLSERDRDFLRRLREALEVCGQRRPVEIELKGFASGSLWNAAEPTLKAKMSQRRIAVDSTASCDPNATASTDSLQNALACIHQYRHDEDLNGEPSKRSTEQIESAKAFNVYLANRRRAAVGEVLGLQAGRSKGIRFIGKPWENHSEMEKAMAIDDSRANGSFGVKGILTRSVAVTLADPSACGRSNVQHIEHAAIALK